MLPAGTLGKACNSSEACTLTLVAGLDWRTLSHILRSATHCHWLRSRKHAASMSFAECGRAARNAADKNTYNLQQSGAGAYLTLAAVPSLPGCAGAKKAVVVMRPPNNCAARCHSTGGFAKFATMKMSACAASDARTNPLAASASL